MNFYDIETSLFTCRNLTGDEVKQLSTICKIEYNEKSGIGAIYQYEFPRGTWRTLFITSYKILEVSHINDITDLELEFVNKRISKLSVTLDWVKWLWSSDEMNVTVIEFSSTALKELSQSTYVPFVSAKPEKDAEVAVYDNAGNKLNGSIIDVAGDFIEFNINITETNIAGAPLLNEYFHVVGIYSGLLDPPDDSAPNTHKGTNIQRVLIAFQEYINEQLGGKTENELWLERIRINELENPESLLGRGAYGSVYKLKERSSTGRENFVAVKVVNGVGLETCKPTEFYARALKMLKRYKLKEHSLTQRENFVAVKVVNGMNLETCKPTEFYARAKKMLKRYELKEHSSTQCENLSQYNLFINEKPLCEYLQSPNESDFKKQVITLCAKSIRANWKQLSRILLPHSKRLPKMALCREVSAFGSKSHQTAAELKVDNVNAATELQMLHVEYTEDNSSSRCATGALLRVWNEAGRRTCISS